MATPVINIGDDIYTARALNRYRSAWATLRLTVVRMTEKALYVKCDDTNIHVWIPRSAFILKYTAISGNGRHSAELARWFEVNEWYVKAENKCADIIL